jgi:hypothetical protein
MSLRTDIKDAIEDVTPPALALENRVRALVAADGRDRRVSLHVRPRSFWNNPFRGTVAMVAAALVVVLIASFMIGGRLWWDSGNGNLGQASSNKQSELHNLESKPLHMPELLPGAVCPFSPDTKALGLEGTVLGDGPVYMYNAWSVGTTDKGDWNAFAFYYVAKDPGLVLVRGGDLATRLPFVFAQYSEGAGGPSGAIATGTVLGTDRLYGETFNVYPEAVLQDTSRLRPVNQQLIVMFAIPRATLCWAIQFDGPGFTQTIVWGWDSAQEKGN